MTSVWEEFKHAGYLAIRTIIPEERDKIPINASTGIYPVLCYAPFVFLAYLTRRPDTFPIRLLLLPSAITGILIAAYRFTWTVPELNVYNWGQCLWAAVAIAKALDFSLAKDGMLKVGETAPGVKKGKDKSKPYDGSEIDDRQDKRYPYVATWLRDALDVIHSLRGLNWKFGQGVYIPPQTRPLQRDAFLQATLKSFIKNYLLLDTLEAIIKLFPGVGTPIGGSIFYSNLSVPTRYIVSTTIHILSGSAVLAGFGMVYDLVTLIAVGIFGSSPLSWPPVVGHPWQSDSMHRFWSREWHQLLRRTFIVYGGIPGKWLAGQTGMLLGTFLASGLFHECAMHAMGRGYDYNAVIFFFIQGPILLLEKLWRRITGKRVEGPYGRLWVYFNMFVCAQPMMNSWHRRGLGGGMVIPPNLSPARWILLPFIQRFLEFIRLIL